MKKEDLLNSFIRFDPKFNEFWVVYNYRQEDWVDHTLCSVFTDFYVDHLQSARSEKIIELFETIEGIIAGDPNDQDVIANALCTSFLEDIASTEVGEQSLSYMGEHSKKFFLYWHSLK